MTDKPLNLRVAEALGLKLARRWDGILYPLGHPDTPPDAAWCLEAGGRIPPYGEDSPDGWSVTGPLMGKFHISLLQDGDAGPWVAGNYSGGFWPNSDAIDGQMSCHASVSSPAQAVAMALLALAEAGRLPK